MLRPILVSGLIVVAASAWAGPVPLTGEAIRQELVGFLLKIDTPLGVVIPVRVSGDGLVSGDAGVLASTLGAAQDRGRWWIDNDRLCVKWFRWFEAQTHCLTLEHEGTKIYWRDATGESGTATVTRSEPRPAELDPHRLIDAGQPRTPSTSPPLSSEPSVAATPALNKPNEDVRPLRFAAVDLSAGFPPAPSSEPGPSKLGVGTSDPPASATHLSTEPIPLPVQVASKSPKPILTPMPSFRVTRVAMDDALIIRSGPSEYHPSVGVIPPDGNGVQIVGACHDLWCPVRHHRSTGWVNRYYLADENASRGAESATTARDR
jgi:hypothetical protein